MSDETKMDAEDINELRRIQTEMNKCYQRAKETEKQMDWHIWNDMLEVWYSKCADSGEGLLRTIDALTAERDAARAELATLRDRLTKIADENIRIYDEYVSVGNDQDDVSVAAWGAAGWELRAALGESEGTE